MSNILREGVEPYSTIFERLDALEERVTAINNSVTEQNNIITEMKDAVNTATSDTGWRNFTCASGISVYSSAQQPRYRKIGKFVILTGAVKGVKNDRTIIGTLPTGFRPSKVISFVQNMSATNGIANVARWQIQTDGDVEMQYNDYPWEELDGTEWFPIDVIFAID